MSVWYVLGGMTLAVVLALALPLLRRNRAVSPTAAHDLEVYRDQIAEIERDRQRGTINDAEAEAARAEIGRRVLSAAHRLPGETKALWATTGGSRAVPLLIAAAAPLAALAIYSGYAGSPGLPDRPLASRQLAPDDQSGRIAQMVDGLAARLKENPNDLDGWMMLARSYATLDRPAAAVAAWRRILELSNDAPAYAAPFGEALVREADGIVTPEARTAFERARATDPRDPLAQFYLGLAALQEGDARAALQTWTDMIAMAPPDAPWVANIRERIARVAADARIDPATIRPSAAALDVAARTRAPSAADVEAVQRMSPEERMALVRATVDQLGERVKAAPDDLEAWRRLGRGQQLLGETDRARESYAKAAALAPERADVLLDYAKALIGERGPDTPLPDAFVAVMRRVLALDPENGEALWFVGRAEMEAGRKDAALALWDRLLSRMPPDAPASAEIRGQIERLRQAN